MEINKYVAILGCFIASLSTYAAAIPLNYDEAVDGDISFASPLAFDFGVNTVTGTVSCSLASCDFDNFNATLPTPGVLESITLSLTQGDGGNGSWAKDFRASDQDYNLLISGAVDGGGNFFWPIGASVTGLKSIGLNNFPAGMVNNYKITLVFSSAPAPPVLGLMSIGVVGVGAATRRRKKLN